MRKAFSAPAIFTGSQWLTGHSVLVNEGIIEDLVPVSGLPADVETVEWEGCSLIPSFIDVQVYGASGKLFALYPEPGTLRLMNESFLREGTILFQPTVATNSAAVFKKCIDAVRTYWEQGGQGVSGLHLEGPWISEEKKGAHVKEYIHAPSLEEVKDLLDYGRDIITMITLAPEVCGQEVIDYILSRGIIVSAGHSSATATQATTSFNGGIPVVTHLYNAMSPLNHREPGLVGAVLGHEKVRASIIPDGHHVDYRAISIAKRLMGSRLFAITDAVTETGSGPYRHHLTGDKYECNGVLSGSALSMHKAFVNLVLHAGIGMDEALRMCSLYPAEVLGLNDRYGKIAPGYKGQILAINRQLDIVHVISG